ncbi:MAG: glycosyltransferase [Solirubrobacterales bacterium]|nr:glycosyltransferase [Solirubrobacterales bacterium]
MPLFDQAAYLPRALRGLRSQTLSAWELVIVDDGSRDGPEDVLRPWLEDSRVTLHRLERNRGLGAALNVALGHARAAVVAYLPADDVFFAAHLETLLAALSDETVVLAHASVAYQVGVHHRRAAQVEGEGLQLVQVAHRVTEDRWTERSQLVTDDLERMLWARLRDRGARVATGRVTCEWVDHPWQRHKVIREPRGGLNLYRAHYGVGEPLRFHSSTGYLLEEEPLYRRFRERPATPPALDGLKIVLAGELAYNPERVLALEERGHRLFGLWLEEPEWYNAVGPLPFGHVEDLPARGWQAAIRALRPDVIYGLLNWQAVPLAQRILEADLGVPFVFHLKESPHWAVSTGHWPALREVYARADGRIYSSVEMRDWLEPLLPELGQPVLVLDGDLPKREWFDAAPTRRLSELDGDCTRWCPAGPSGCCPSTSPSSPVTACTCTSTAPPEGVASPSSCARASASRPGTSTRTRWLTSGRGCASSRATTPAGCITCAATTRATRSA